MQVIEAAKTSMGYDISEVDMTNVLTFAERVTHLEEYRQRLREYLNARMHSVSQLSVWCAYVFVCVYIYIYIMPARVLECSHTLGKSNLSIYIYIYIYIHIYIYITHTYIYTSIRTISKIMRTHTHTQVAPNLSSLVGEIVGARLISHAGSLTNLAKYPASTVQILGAEKALFRALKTKVRFFSFFHFFPRVS